MTLKEIAEANCLDYMTVYSGAMRAGVLKRFRKMLSMMKKKCLKGLSYICPKEFPEIYRK